MSNRVDPDQARRFVGPDLGLNCLQRLTADDTSRQIVNAFSQCMALVTNEIPTIKHRLPDLSTNKQEATPILFIRF